MARLNLRKFIGMIAYPPGSIYITTNNINPSEIWGGEWEKLSGTFLWAADESRPIGSTGGSEQISAHTHGIPALSGTAASSTHYHVVTKKTTTYASGTQTSWRCLSWPGTNADYSQTVYTNNGTSDGAHTHSVTTTAATSDSAGEGNAGNMPPFTSVNMWKRLANFPL